MQNIGVTGSNGFIGWHLCKTLSLYPAKFKLIDFERDFFEHESRLDEFVSKCDIIVHLAGVNRHQEESVIYDANVSIAKKINDSLIRTNFKGTLLFSSSIQEEKNNVFGNAKKVARELFATWANDYGGSFKGLIIPNVFGAFGRPYYNSVVSTFCYQLVNNENPVIENDATVNLIYIDKLIGEIISHFDTEISEGIIKVKHTDSYKVSEILNFLEEYKYRYFQKGEIPALKSEFQVNLFNTFRSYLDLNTFFPVIYQNHIDERGNFVEILKQDTGGQVSFSTTKTGITRGNHFHTRKIERFSVIKGKALIRLRKKGTAEVYEYFLSGDKPAYVDMPIWFIHSIENIGEEDLYTVFWINEFYNSDDPDTYFEKAKIE
jgi:UDP-2-acetamido-2,6-beta-L-arabino-hexul-4-ose reductase